MRIGLDIGYSSVKLAYGPRTKPELARLPVGAAPIANLNQSLSGASAIGRGHHVLLDGNEWVAGIEPARLDGFVPTMDASYPTTDEYRALFYAALSHVGAPRIERLVTGLPVKHFMEGSVREELTKMMTGRHHINSDLSVEVEQVMIIPQPAGAFGAHRMDTLTGRSPHKVHEGDTVLVVDPGHYSLDWVVYHDSFNLKSSGSTSRSGEAVIKEAAEALSRDFGVKVRAPKLQEAVLRSDERLRAGTRELDFRPALEKAAADIVNSNLRTLRGTLRDVEDSRGIDMVLLTGGGANLFRKALQHAFPEARVISMHDSIHANARGFFVWAHHGN